METIEEQLFIIEYMVDLPFCVKEWKPFNMDYFVISDKGGDVAQYLNITKNMKGFYSEEIAIEMLLKFVRYNQFKNKLNEHRFRVTKYQIKCTTSPILEIYGYNNI